MDAPCESRDVQQAGKRDSQKRGRSERYLIQSYNRAKRLNPDRDLSTCCICLDAFVDLSAPTLSVGQLPIVSVCDHVLHHGCRKDHNMAIMNECRETLQHAESEGVAWEEYFLCVMDTLAGGPCPLCRHVPAHPCPHSCPLRRSL